ncbi:hypothetical protein F4693_002534 [Sphingomonas endophytica]|uniref:DUF2946 domain-containing protein n=1 Tax=Sphingomonas endophytica TaxID=869719 RepID=A0A7X0JF80_9SPHN|nr:hypothetical protein [Sphingomonas endophytica]MBB6505542.1 hypothetical protein [Sphingomonas endophytica]
MTGRAVRDNDGPVQAVRQFLAQRHLALLLCAGALLLKLLVPAGYMIVADHGRLALAVCPGVVPQSAPMASAAMGDTMVHAAMPGHDETKDHGKSEIPCAFAGLSAPATGAIDAVLLAVALAVVAALALRAVAATPPTAAPYLRPPLRGPPLPN